MRTRQKSERTKSGTFSGRMKMVTTHHTMCYCCRLHKSWCALIIHASSQLSSQIRLERGNSFRVSWKTKTSWGWYSSTSQRRFRKNLRRRSINGHIPMRLISISLTLNLHDPDCLSRSHAGDIQTLYPFTHQSHEPDKHIFFCNTYKSCVLDHHHFYLKGLTAISIAFRIQSIRCPIELGSC